MPYLRSLTLLAVFSIGALGCSSADAPLTAAEATDSSSSQAAEPERSEGQWILRRDKPVIFAQTTQDGFDDAEAGGVLELVDNCLLVNGDPVVWPPSSSWQDEPPAVRLGNGIVLEVGDDFRTSGGWNEISSVAEAYGSKAVEWFNECRGDGDGYVRIAGNGLEVLSRQLRFDDPDLAGLCESVENDFAEGEPSESESPDEAARTFVNENSILEGLDLSDGQIRLRGQIVGTYQVVERPDATFAVTRGEWCFADS